MGRRCIAAGVQDTEGPLWFLTLAFRQYGILKSFLATKQGK